MDAVTIHDLRTTPPVGMLAVDRIHLLRLMGSVARASVWTCDGVEAFGDAADHLGEVFRSPRHHQR